MRINSVAVLMAALALPSAATADDKASAPKEVPSLVASPSRLPKAFSIAAYAEKCGDPAAIYAPCVDQRDILNAGLEYAHKRYGRMFIEIGSAGCDACAELHAWLTTVIPKDMAIVALSTLDANGEARSEVFGEIATSLKLTVSEKTQSDLPILALVYAKTGTVVGNPVSGFVRAKPERQMEYIHENIWAKLSSSGER